MDSLMIFKLLKNIYSTSHSELKIFIETGDKSDPLKQKK
jgi:hypothetical protein